jgi:hypothetical protein
MYVTQAYRGSEVITPVFPNFGARWRRLVSLTADCFTPGQCAPVPIEWEARRRQFLKNKQKCKQVNKQIDGAESVLRSRNLLGYTRDFSSFVQPKFYLDVHGSVHHNTNLIEMTNKMQLCWTIYYSIVP